MMKNTPIKPIAVTIILILVTGFIVWFLDHPQGNIPPLGKLLDPFHGYLALADLNELPPENLQFDQLTDQVTIVWDEEHIPHIFAKNDHDLYFAQGYVTAFHRLWQMEFQTLAAAGRMSEIIGDRALTYDRFQRRIGMVYAAEKAVEAMSKDPAVLEAVTAFSEGVNAYIDELSPEHYPVEYKILDYAPEHWTLLKTGLLLKSMAWTLTGRSSDLPLTKIRNKFGQDVFRELFPLFPDFVEPIVTEMPPFKPIKVKAPESPYEAEGPDDVYPFASDRRNGSNNWAISGDRSASGYPILANDPHLGLTMPAIWYMVHLVTPEQNVMGVTIPGAPAVISGFNENIAWGVTNGNDDVMDWLDITFRDDSRNEYWYDNRWVPTKKRVERIRIRGGETFLDTVTYTHHGPVVWDYTGQTTDFSRWNLRFPAGQVSAGRALRWLAHDETYEVRAILSFNKARNMDEFVEALDDFTCPGQNFVYADHDGNIAIWHSGHPPVRWKEQGKFIGDGSDPLYDWKEFIPLDQMPHEINPKKGYVSSANQNPAGKSYPYYLADSYWMSFRGSRINDRLKELGDAALEDVASIQLDNYSKIGRMMLPEIIHIIRQQPMNERERMIIDSLSVWDLYYNGDSWEATVFNEWVEKIEELTWADDFGGKDEEHYWPFLTDIMELMETDRESHWFDLKSTAEKENFDTLCRIAFREIIQELSEKMGDDATRWLWQDFRGTDIPHLAKIPGLGRMDLKTGGGMGIPNATMKTFGPSWRYAVEMTDPVKAMGIYPGGQSGHPGSPFYDNFTDRWVKGEYISFQFSPDPQKIRGTRTTMTGRENQR